MGQELINKQIVAGWSNALYEIRLDDLIKLSPELADRYIKRMLNTLTDDDMILLHNELNNEILTLLNYHGTA